jgi:uroporphyrinogen decarboxylase
LFSFSKRNIPPSNQVLHQMLQTLAENIADYACYMADSGAQVIQIFDSWAATLSPRGERL